MALSINTLRHVAKFIYRNIITRFGFLVDLVNDEMKHFMNEVIPELTSRHRIIYNNTSTYHF